MPATRIQKRLAFKYVLHTLIDEDVDSPISIAFRRQRIDQISDWVALKREDIEGWTYPRDDGTDATLKTHHVSHIMLAPRYYNYHFLIRNRRIADEEWVYITDDQFQECRGPIWQVEIDAALEANRLTQPPSPPSPSKLEQQQVSLQEELFNILMHEIQVMVDLVPPVLFLEESAFVDQEPPHHLCESSDLDLLVDVLLQDFKHDFDDLVYGFERIMTTVPNAPLVKTLPDDDPFLHLPLQHCITRTPPEYNGIYCIYEWGVFSVACNNNRMVYCGIMVYVTVFAESSLNGSKFIFALRFTYLLIVKCPPATSIVSPQVPLIENVSTSCYRTIPAPSTFPLLSSGEHDSTPFHPSIGNEFSLVDVVYTPVLTYKIWCPLHSRLLSYDCSCCCGLVPLASHTLTRDDSYAAPKQHLTTKFCSVDTPIRLYQWIIKFGLILYGATRSVDCFVKRLLPRTPTRSIRRDANSPTVRTDVPSATIFIPSNCSLRILLSWNFWCLVFFGFLCFCDSVAPVPWRPSRTDPIFPSITPPLFYNAGNFCFANIFCIGGGFNSVYCRFNSAFGPSITSLADDDPLRQSDLKFLRYSTICNSATALPFQVLFAFACELTSQELLQEVLFPTVDYWLNDILSRPTSRTEICHDTPFSVLSSTIDIQSYLDSTVPNGAMDITESSCKVSLSQVDYRMCYAAPNVVPWSKIVKNVGISASGTYRPIPLRFFPTCGTSTSIFEVPLRQFSVSFDCFWSFDECFNLASLASELYDPSDKRFSASVRDRSARTVLVPPCLACSLRSTGTPCQVLCLEVPWMYLFFRPQDRLEGTTAKTVTNPRFARLVDRPHERPCVPQVLETSLKLIYFRSCVLVAFRHKFFCPYRLFHCPIFDASASENVSDIEIFVISAGAHKIVKGVRRIKNPNVLPLFDKIVLVSSNGAVHGLASIRAIVKKSVCAQLNGTAPQASFGPSVHHAIVAYCLKNMTKPKNMTENYFNEMIEDASTSWFPYCLSVYPSCKFTSTEFTTGLLDNQVSFAGPLKYGEPKYGELGFSWFLSYLFLFWHEGVDIFTVCVLPTCPHAILHLIQTFSTKGSDKIYRMLAVSSKPCILGCFVPQSESLYLCGSRMIVLACLHMPDPACHCSVYLYGS